MSDEEEQQIDVFFWENLFNDMSETSGSEKAELMPEGKKENEKKSRRGAMMMKKGKGVSREKKEGGETLDYHEIHKRNERERTKKIRNLFSDLQALLPQLPSKIDKSTIVDEAINTIKSLESTLQTLERKKQESLQGPSLPSVAATSKLGMLSTRETFMADQVSTINSSANAKTTTTTLSGSDLGLGSSSGSDSGLPVKFQTWTSPNVVMNIYGNDAQFSIYAPKKHGLLTGICCVLEKYKMEATTVNISSDVDSCVYIIQARLTNRATDQFPEMINVEEIYKQAAEEIMSWVIS